MEFSIQDALVNHCLANARNDEKLARLIAEEFLSRVPTVKLGEYLLTRERMLDLLTDKVQRDPEQAWKDLKELAAGGAVAVAVAPVKEAPPPKRGRVAAKPMAAVGKKKAAVKPAKPAKPAKKAAAKPEGRVRLSADEIQQKKDLVLDFLGRNGWSSRRQIMDQAAIPSPAIYNRIVLELKTAEKVVQEGHKAKALYALSGTPLREDQIVAEKPAHASDATQAADRRKGRSWTAKPAAKDRPEKKKKGKKAKK